MVTTAFSLQQISSCFLHDLLLARYSCRNRSSSSSSSSVSTTWHHLHSQLQLSALLSIPTFEATVVSAASAARPRSRLQVSGEEALILWLARAWMLTNFLLAIQSSDLGALELFSPSWSAWTCLPTHSLVEVFLLQQGCGQKLGIWGVGLHWGVCFQKWEIQAKSCVFKSLQKCLKACEKRLTLWEASQRLAALEHKRKDKYKNSISSCSAWCLQSAWDHDWKLLTLELLCAMYIGLHWPEFWRNWKMHFCCGFSRSILWMLKKLQKQFLSTKNGGRPWCHSSRMSTFLSLKSLGSSMPRSYTCKDKTKEDIPFLSCLDETMFPTRRISKSFKVCTNKWISVEERSILELSVEFTDWSMSYSHVQCLWISCHRWSCFMLSWDLHCKNGEGANLDTECLTVCNQGLLYTPLRRQSNCKLCFYRSSR